MMKVEVEEKPRLESLPAKTKTRRDGLYVHPKGKISKQTKVSCASCISGHRSGECNHFDRILLQIRAAGRPSNTCHHSVSCGGACLKQKAFVVPGEQPKWCRDHRSCIENWEHSEHCPPYPVSSKRKGRSSSPSRSRQTSPPPSVAQKGSSKSATPSQKTSNSACCSRGSSSTRPGPSPMAPTGPIIPIVQPIMVASSSQLTPSNWTPKNLPGRSSSRPQFDIPAPPIPFPTSSSDFVSSLTSQSPIPPLPRTSDFSFLDPYSMPFPQFEGQQSTTTNPYADDSSIYFDELAKANHPPLSSYSDIHPAAYLPSSSHGQTHTQGPKHDQQQCPGNGFQCPCDENCVCEECYTHSRGFWTLPVDLGNTQQQISDYREPPTQISPSIQGQSQWPNSNEGGGAQDDLIDPRTLYAQHDFFDPRLLD